MLHGFINLEAGWIWKQESEGWENGFRLFVASCVLQAGPFSVCFLPYFPNHGHRGSTYSPRAYIITVNENAFGEIRVLGEHYPNTHAHTHRNTLFLFGCY